AHRVHSFAKRGSQPVDSAVDRKAEQSQAALGAYHVAAAVAEDLLHFATVLEAELAGIGIQQESVNVREPANQRRVGHQAFPPAILGLLRSSSRLDLAAITASARRCA